MHSNRLFIDKLNSMLSYGKMVKGGARLVPFSGPLLWWYPVSGPQPLRIRILLLRLGVGHDDDTLVSYT